MNIWYWLQRLAVGVGRITGRGWRFARSHAWRSALVWTPITAVILLALGLAAWEYNALINMTRYAPAMGLVGDGPRCLGCRKTPLDWGDYNSLVNIVFIPLQTALLLVAGVAGAYTLLQARRFKQREVEDHAVRSYWEIERRLLETETALPFDEQAVRRCIWAYWSHQASSMTNGAGASSRGGSMRTG